MFNYFSFYCSTALTSMCSPNKQKIELRYTTRCDNNVFHDTDTGSWFNFGDNNNLKKISQPCVLIIIYCRHWIPWKLCKSHVFQDTGSWAYIEDSTHLKKDATDIHSMDTCLKSLLNTFLFGNAINILTMVIKFN